MTTQCCLRRAFAGDAVAVAVAVSVVVAAIFAFASSFFELLLLPPLWIVRVALHGDQRMTQQTENSTKRKSRDGTKARNEKPAEIVLCIFLYLSGSQLLLRSLLSSAGIHLLAIDYLQLFHK